MLPDPSQPLGPSPAGTPARKALSVLVLGAALLVVAPVVVFGACAIAYAGSLWLIMLPLALAAAMLFVLHRAAWRAWKVRPDSGGEARWSIVLGAALGTLIVLAATLTGLLVVFLAGMGAPGRPLRDAKGRPRLPRVRCGGALRDGGEFAPSLAGIDALTRVRLALEWIEDGRMEHAAVGAFIVLARDLRRLGAPRDLIHRAHTAALEEEAHARLCFALASAYAGCRVYAEALPLPARAANVQALVERVAIESAVDGCIGEEAAATVAERCLARATDASVRRVLATIARDERSHAILAQDILDWCCASSPHAGQAVGRAIDAFVPSARRRHRENVALFGRPHASDRLEAESAAIGAMRRFRGSSRAERMSAGASA